MIKLNITIFLIIFLTSCSSKSDQKGSNLPGHEGTNYHTDPNYKYEYRTGTSGDYEYNYDVNGVDEEGNSVDGNVDMDGKYGNGFIEDEFGNEKEVDVEWTGYGTLEATDEDGNTYQLETN